MRDTGKLDHISFRSTGLHEFRRHLEALGIRATKPPVPGFPRYQVFFRDPVGIKVELTFDADELSEAAGETRPRAQRWPSFTDTCSFSKPPRREWTRPPVAITSP